MILFHPARRFSYLVLFIILILNLTERSSVAQNITFSYDPVTENFAPDQFRTDLNEITGSNSSIRLRDNEIVFGNGTAMLAGYQQLSISEDRSFAGALFMQGGHVAAEIYRTDGSLIHRISRLADYDPDDPSVKLYMLNDGSFIYRDNIAGFNYFDERGEFVYRASNSFGSPDGESISEVTATPYGHEITLFNPRIYDGDRIGSRIQRASFSGETRPVSMFSNETIESVHLHESGRLMLAHVIDESTGSHRGKVITYRGDVLADIDYEDTEVLGLELSPDARYVTARASGRAMVHRSDTGERLGSASFSEQVLAANYMPDGVLAVLTGRISGSELNSLRAHLIDINRRRVVRERTSLTTHRHKDFTLSLDYDEAGVYRLKGVNREILIRHSL